MTLRTTTIEDGKYAVVFNDETGELFAHRHGEFWQNFSGNKFIYCMASEIERLRKIVDQTHSWAVCAAIASPEDMAQNFPHIVEITTPGFTYKDDEL